MRSVIEVIADGNDLEDEEEDGEVEERSRLGQKQSEDHYPASLLPSPLSPTPRLDSEVDSGTGSVCEEEAEEEEGRPAAPRKLIQPDLAAMSQLLNFDEEEEEEEEEQEEEEEDSATDHSEERVQDRTGNQDCRKPYNCGQQSEDSIALGRRHSESGPQRLRVNCSSTYSSSSSSSGQTLNLSLEEVKHIRTALTKAELEGLPPAVSQGRLCFSCMKTKFGLFWRGQPCTLCTMVICSGCVRKTRIPVEQFSAIPVTALCPPASLTSSSPSSSSSSYSSSSSSSSSTSSSTSSTSSSSSSDTPAPTVTEFCFTTNSSPNSPDSERRGSPPSLPYLTTVSGSIQTPASLPYSLTAVQGREKYNTLPRRRWSMTNSRVSEEKEKERVEGRLLLLCADCRGMVVQVLKSSTTSSKDSQSVFFNNITPVTSKEQRY